MTDVGRTDWEYFNDADTVAHTGFILAEEAALKEYLAGHAAVTGRNRKTGEAVSKEVPVHFRWPDSRTNISFPYILIDLLQITPDYPRWTSEWDYGAMGSDFEDPDTNDFVRHGWYYPSMNDSVGSSGSDDSPPVDGDGLPIDEPTVSDTGLSIKHYLPFKLFFQVSVFSNQVQTDRFLMGRFITDIFPARQFFIHVPTDGTWRRCELMEWASADTQETTEATKRVFRKIYTISMEAEVPQSQVLEVSKVRDIHVDIYDTDSVDTNGNLFEEPADHLWNDPHNVAVGNFTVPPSGP